MSLQSDAVAAALGGARIEWYAEGGETVTYRLADTDELVTVDRGWPGHRRPAEDLARESELLRRIAARVPVAVPQVDESRFEQGLIVVRRIPGVPLLDLPPVTRETWTGPAEVCGTVLGLLHTWPAEHYSDVADVDDTPPSTWCAEALDDLDELGQVLTARQLDDARRFLAQEPPEAPAAADFVLTHNDLGIEHILVTPAPRMVTGIIDWSDAAITDPALDFARILRDLGPRALTRAKAGYRAAGGSADLATRRVGFYAACMLIEDLRFGLERDRTAYVEKSLRAWDRTFRGR